MAKRRFESGSSVDGFLIGEAIHRGGMATLYAVTREGTELPLLMKVPKLSEGEDPATIVSFEMEQMIMPRLAGVHVPRFIAAGDFAGGPYIVMERILGPSLLKRLPDLPLGSDEVAAIGARVALALADLHRQHVVHLDVKPSNIMMRPTGEAALIDFGLARHDQLPDLMQEEFRLPYGTAPYMAPEQVLGVRREPRSDLFALGVLLYFFATGVRPFGDPKGISGLKKRIWRDPRPPRALKPDLPPWLQEVILRCLEVDPKLRHPSAAQLAFELQHPDAVKLTVRAEKLRQDPFTTVMRRRFNQDETVRTAKQPVARQLDQAPIIVVAVDLGEDGAALADALRASVRRTMQAVPNGRLACVNVLKLQRIALDQSLDEEGRNKHVGRLAELRHWAEPLKLGEGRVTFHVLEAVDPAAAILEFAEANPVDQIVLGARAASLAKRFLGSVSAEIAAKAPCTVTVVRPQRRVSEIAAETSATSTS